MSLDIQNLAEDLARRLAYVHVVKSDGVIVGTSVLYPDGSRVTLYLSADRPGLVFVSDFEGGRRRARMEGREALFDAAIRRWPFDPPFSIEGDSIYVRVPVERLEEAALAIANASALALREALAAAKSNPE